MHHDTPHVYRAWASYLTAHSCSDQGKTFACILLISIGIFLINKGGYTVDVPNDEAAILIESWKSRRVWASGVQIGL